VVKNGPVSIEGKDTPESMEKKIRAFFVKEYTKAHPERKNDTRLVSGFCVSLKYYIHLIYTFSK